jgi:Sigma-70, region 4
VGVRRGVQRVTLAEAAELLGISKGAVRQRVRRGTLRSDKGEDGRVYVYVDPSVDAIHADDPHGEGVLVEELRDRIRYLERQVEEERSARYRADELLARLMERVQLEAPTDVPGSPETAQEEPERAEPDLATREAQEGVQRPWWRRVFGR